MTHSLLHVFLLVLLLLLTSFLYNLSRLLVRLLTILAWHYTIFDCFHLSVFQSHFINNYLFSLISQLRPLLINVLEVSMTNDLAIWKLDFTSGQEFCLFDIKLLEGLGACQTRTFHTLLCIRRGGHRLRILVVKVYWALVITNQLERARWSTLLHWWLVLSLRIYDAEWWICLTLINRVNHRKFWIFSRLRFNHLEFWSCQLRWRNFFLSKFINNIYFTEVVIICILLVNILPFFITLSCLSSFFFPL